jgi:hypothetical protein
MLQQPQPWCLDIDQIIEQVLDILIGLVYKRPRQLMLLEDDVL